MSVDINQMVALLKAVGVDTTDVASMSKKLSAGGDEQIIALIQKLQEAQLNNAQQSAGQRNANNTAPPEPEVDEDESEDSDDANYPMVGPGISDDISIMSDLTTPTVLVGVPVPEEEHYYQDALPPMIIGGGPLGGPSMQVNPTKRKNLVSQVRPGIAAPQRRNMPVPATRAGGPAAPQQSSGAAAQRRNKYNTVVSKLDSPPEKPTNPSAKGQAAARPVKKPVAPPPAEKRVAKKKAPTRTSSAEADFAGLASSRANSASSWTEPQSSWNAFESSAPVPASGPTIIDNDGFLVGDSFDPFAANSDPFSSPAAGDLAFHRGASAQQQQQHHQQQAPKGGLQHPPGDTTPRRPRPSQKAAARSNTTTNTNPNFAAQQASIQPLRKPKNAPSAGRRARRASLTT